MSELNAKVIKQVNGNSNTKPVVRLRAATYLAPSIPIEYFEIVLEYLKLRLGYIDTSLLYESNSENVEKVFDNNEVDIAWINVTNLLTLLPEEKVVLLPLSSTHIHPKCGEKPGYYCDVIVHKSHGNRFKSFQDLRGCNWTYISGKSMSGNIITLRHLKQMGEDASFFGSTQPSSSHLQSIHMVLNRETEATAVDGNCLQIFLDRNPQFREELTVLTSFGPLPPYPIVVNKNMPKQLRNQIVKALLEMHLNSEYTKKLLKYRVKRFMRINGEEFAAENDLLSDTHHLNFDIRYY